jgi:hypothetical protein
MGTPLLHQRICRSRFRSATRWNAAVSRRSSTLHSLERRVERDGSVRVLYAARIGHCRCCPLRAQCQENSTTSKPRRVSAVFWPLTSTTSPPDEPLPEQRKHRSLLFSRICSVQCAFNIHKISLDLLFPRHFAVFLLHENVVAPLIVCLLSSRCVSRGEWQPFGVKLHLREHLPPLFFLKECSIVAPEAVPDTNNLPRQGSEHFCQKVGCGAGVCDT